MLCYGAMMVLQEEHSRFAGFYMDVFPDPKPHDMVDYTHELTSSIFRTGQDPKLYGMGLRV